MFEAILFVCVVVYNILNHMFIMAKIGKPIHIAKPDVDTSDCYWRFWKKEGITLVLGELAVYRKGSEAEKVAISIGLGKTLKRVRFLRIAMFALVIFLVLVRIIIFLKNGEGA